MNVLVVYCHPVETSFHAALHQQVLANLKAAGHTVDDCDLYAENFNPVLSREERMAYHDVPANQVPLAGYVERLRRAEAIVLCFPTWCFGMPAMLKGFFDRVFMPGVAFDISDPADIKPMLTHIKRISAVVTYGRPRWMAWYMGDPPRKIVTRYLRRLTGNNARVDFHACYHMNIAKPPRLARFMRQVGQSMARFA
ncbi:MAG: NAD(P)H-dependent oxidoreductase [Ramlibacter sp.]